MNAAISISVVSLKYNAKEKCLILEQTGLQFHAKENNYFTFSCIWML
jgi:hypothetical protein